MTKYSIITGISALLLALIVPVECMGSGQQEEATCLAAFQNDLKEEVYQTGIAFLGYIGEGVPVQDILDYTKQADYLEAYPFLQNGTVVDAGGYEVYAIVPGSGWSINIYPSEMTEDAEYRDNLETPYYKGAPDEIIILRCNISEIYSNVMVSATEENMSVIYRPAISLRDGHLAEENHCYDFSIYYYDEEYGEYENYESDADFEEYEEYEDNQTEDNRTDVQIAYDLLCGTDEVSYYLGLGMSLRYTESKEVIDGRECMVFVLGTDHEEHFVSEHYYAVHDNLVYYYDVLNDQWNILGRG